MNERYTIKHVCTEAMNVVSVRDKISLSQIGLIIGMANGKVSKHRLTKSSEPFTRYYDNEYDESCMDMEYCVPVVEFREGVTKVIDKIDCIMTLHIGYYNELGYAYASLYDYIKLNNLIQDGPIFEKYLHCEGSKNIVEVYIPVKKA